MRRGLALSVPLLVAVVAGGCSGPQSVVDPQGEAAEKIAGVWWWLVGLSAPVYLLVLVALALAVFRRRSRASTSRSLTPVVLGGIVLPALILPPLLFLNFDTLAWFAGDGGGEAVEIEVIGHKWWWEVRYRDLGIVTANEIQIPAGRRVRLRLFAEDVIHSLWVPSLAGKMDLIPGQENSLELQADRPGVYRGQCAEYCGIQHAKMGLRVVALERPAFAAWVADQRNPAVAPTTPLQQAGLRAFLTNACVGCHTIRGTPADGDVGPDLTHVGSRLTIGAGAAPNTPGHLGGWISNSQTIKPGNLMPPIALAPEELRGLIAYLESLE